MCYEPESPPEFEWEIQDKELWIYAEENGNPNDVANFMQLYLKKWHPQHSLELTWAGTCSKMRTDGFSGGGVFVTAKEQKWMEGGTFVHQEFEKWKKAKAKRRKGEPESK